MPKSGTLKATKPTAARQYQAVAVTDLSGGLDLRRSATLMGQNRARVLRNYSLATPGELSVRAGYRVFSTTALGSSRAQGGQRVYLAATQFTLWAWGGNIYRPPDNGGASSVVEFSTRSETHQIYFPYDRTLVAVLDGTNRPVKSTGSTTWTAMGIDGPTGVSTVSSGGGTATGTLSTSEFAFAFSYKDRGTAHESNVSTVSTVSLTDPGQGVHLEVPNSSDGQVDAIVIYARNKTAGEQVLRRASSFAIQGTTAAGQHSTGRLGSSAWSANSEAPTNHQVPEGYSFAAVWKNRWWAVDGTVTNRLHFTELFQPQSWPTLFYIDIPFERGDEIRALTPLGDTLVVWGQSKAYLIIGQTSLDFEVKPSAGVQAGALGPRAVAVIEHGIVHASAEGVFIFDGATDTYLSYDIEPGWRDLLKNGSVSDLPNVAMVYHFPFKELRIAVTRLYPRATAGEWVLDLNRTRENNAPAWTDTDRMVGGYISWDGNEPTGSGLRGRLLTWDSTSGRLFKESTGTSANSSHMIAEYEGPHLTMGMHRARFIDLHGEYEPHAGAFTVEAVVDELSQGQVSVTIGSGLAQYDSATYDTSAYAGAGRRMWTHPLPLAAEGRTVWLKTSYTGQDQFRWFTYHVGIVPESAVRGFSE